MFIEISRNPNQLKYWSNACGDLHHHGEYDITFGELPAPLQRTLADLFCEGQFAMNCYLAEYEKEYYIALEADYDREYADDLDITYDELVERGKRTAEALAFAFPNYTVLFGEDTLKWSDGSCESQILLLVPCDVSKEEYDRIGKKADLIVWPTQENVKALWQELSDIPFDENEDGELILAEDWYIFPAGTEREEIWRWFDRAYNKGVHALLYPASEKPKPRKTAISVAYEYNEFVNLAESIGLSVDYDLDGLSMSANDGSNPLKALSTHFGKTVSSVHADNLSPLGVWIVFGEAEQALSPEEYQVPRGRCVMDRDTLITKLTQIAFSSYEYSEVAREAIFLIQKYEKEIDTLCQERCSEDSGSSNKIKPCRD